MKHLHLPFAFALLLVSTMATAQLNVNNTTITPEELVNDILLGQGVTATNITFNNSAAIALNPNVQAGFFSNGTSTNIGIPNGVILGSGNVQLAIGPQTGAQTNNTGVVNLTGDPDLNQIMGVTSQNCAILEFDFIPQGNEITFNYVFGSNEYNQYVFSSFNDGFGFFLSGPGILGPFSGNAANLAVLPGTSTPVTINNVNQGQGGCPAPNGCTNCEYFVDNCGGATINYNGFTTVLTATAQVICGETYHIKLAIADASDTILDSGVFLEAGSFSSNDVFIEAEIPNAPPNFPPLTLLEGCIDGIVNIWRPNTAEADTVFLEISGTATMGEDYLDLPEFVVFEAGQETIQLEVTTLFDGIEEGDETIEISYTYTSETGCFETEEVTISIELTIQDYFLPEIEIPNEIFLCDGETEVVSAVPNNGFSPFSYAWSTGQSTPQITVGQNGSQLISVEVTDYCENSVSDTVNVIVPDQNTIFWDFVQINAPTGFPANTLLEGCIDGIITFGRVGTSLIDTVMVSISGSAIMGSDYEEIPNMLIFDEGEDVIVVPVTTILDGFSGDDVTIVITYTYIDGCDNLFTETLTLTLLNYIAPSLELEDILLCEGSSTNVSGVPDDGFAPFIYSWSTGDATANIQVTGGDVDSVFVTAVDYCGNDVDAAFEVTIPEPFVVPGNFEVCLGGSVRLGPEGGRQPYTISFAEDSATFIDGDFTPLYPGRLWIVYTDACGLSDTSRVAAIVCETEIPNIFSPNNDGFNDRFVIKGTQGFPGSRLEIYNRWGGLVYARDNYDDSWRGEDLAEGVYIYIYYRDDGETFTGTVTLVRTTRR